MPRKPASNRPQINVRLDKFPELLSEIKQAVSDRNISASEFVINAIKSALGKPDITPTDTVSLDAILAEVDKLIDTKLDKRLGEFERQLLAKFRRDDRRPPPEEDRQVSEDARPKSRLKTRPDYQEIRDRVLRSLTTGRGRIAPSAPQYKSALKALDRFISELEADVNPSKKNE